ncbi:MAG: hypothetical protein U0559_01930 [Anaerolineae bacterium]
MKQSARNFWLDVSLFVTCLSTVFTGLVLWLLMLQQVTTIFLGCNRPFWLTVHICSGLTSIAGSVIHVIWHRAWLKALRQRRIASLSSRLRANRIIDRIIWITFLATSVFGALDWITPALENNVSISSRLHGAFGMAWLIGITVHLALHSKWITSTARLYLIRSRYIVWKKDVHEQGLPLVLVSQVRLDAAQPYHSKKEKK